MNWSAGAGNYKQVIVSNQNDLSLWVDHRLKHKGLFSVSGSELDYPRWWNQATETRLRMTESARSEHSGSAARTTLIDGLVEFDLQVNIDSRGWFKENFQLQKLQKLGLPSDFRVVQNNISFNKAIGVTRGIHAEPWDKYISIGNGSAFVAIVDLRAGKDFGKCATFMLDPSRALFVPKGCGNSFQTLDEDTVYTYLVNDYWHPNAKYAYLNLADEELAIAWPIPLNKAELSDKDMSHPRLSEVKPMEL